MDQAPIFADSINTLLNLIEEGARANPRKTSHFVEPADGTLRRATNKRHHIIFGRRGSGKSSLLHKSAEDLKKRLSPVAYVDLEPFKGHHYPDVLLSVLLAALYKFQRQLDEDLRPGLGSALRHIPFTGANIRCKKILDLLGYIGKQAGELESQLYSVDGASLNVQNSLTNSRSEDVGGSVKVPLGGAESVEASIASSVGRVEAKQISEEHVRSKQDWLHRKIIDFQRIFREMHVLTGLDAFLFLDDLYHIHRKDQASLIDYFHRIAKGQPLWLKIGTIKNRSTWYIHNPQPTGLKLGDDADEIDLDLTLEKFAVSRSFLERILETYILESKCPVLDEMMTEGGFDRLVLACGGVARDFLGLFRRAVEETRERVSRSPSHSRGVKIGAEDVNISAGSYGEIKKEEFKLDTLEDRQELERAFAKIRLFCIDKTECNIFLIDQDLQDLNSNFVQELVDLRLIHHVRSRVTIPDRPGKIYRALLLDVSQYTGERARRELEILEFWKEQKKDSLRKASLIYNPNITEEQLQLEIDKKQQAKPVADSDGSQMSLL